MTHDLMRRIEQLGNPRVLVIGDLILDRYISGCASGLIGGTRSPCCEPTIASTGWAETASVATISERWGPRSGSSAESAATSRPGSCGGWLQDQGMWRISGSSSSDDRPTTLKERYIGRAQDPASAADDPGRL